MDGLLLGTNAGSQQTPPTPSRHHTRRFHSALTFVNRKPPARFTWIKSRRKMSGADGKQLDYWFTSNAAERQFFAKREFGLKPRRRPSQSQEEVERIFFHFLILLTQTPWPGTAEVLVFNLNYKQILGLMDKTDCSSTWLMGWTTTSPRQVQPSCWDYTLNVGTEDKCGIIVTLLYTWHKEFIKIN